MYTSSKLKLPLKQFYYLVFIGLLTFVKAIGLGSSNFAYRLLFLASLIFLVFKLISEKWTVKQLVGMFSVGILVIIHVLVSRQETLILSFLVCIGIREVPIRRIIQVIFATRLFGFISVLLGVSLGFLENKEVLMWRMDGFITRYDLGFGHPNQIQSAYFLIVLLFCYLYPKWLNLLTLTVLGLLNHILFLYSASRTSYLLIFITIILAYLLQKSRLLSYGLKRITPYVQIILLVVTVILSKFLMHTTLFSTIDRLLTGRMTYAVQQLQYPITLFGRPPIESILMDNSYSMLPFLYGSVWTVLFMYGYLKTAQHLAAKREYYPLLLFFIMSIYFFLESSLPFALINITLFFISKYFLGEMNPLKSCKESPVLRIGDTNAR